MEDRTVVSIPVVSLLLLLLLSEEEEEVMVLDAGEGG
jgi:hypothetical protein